MSVQFVHEAAWIDYALFLARVIGGLLLLAVVVWFPYRIGELSQARSGEPADASRAWGSGAIAILLVLAGLYLVVGFVRFAWYSWG